MKTEIRCALGKGSTARLLQGVLRIRCCRRWSPGLFDLLLPVVPAVREVQVGQGFRRGQGGPWLPSNPPFLPHPRLPPLPSIPGFRLDPAGPQRRSLHSSPTRRHFQGLPDVRCGPRSRFVPPGPALPSRRPDRGAQERRGSQRVREGRRGSGCRG